MLVRVVTERSVWLIPFHVAHCQTGLTCGPGYSIYRDPFSRHWFEWVCKEILTFFMCSSGYISVSLGCFKGFKGFPADFQGLSKVLGGVCKVCPRFSGSRVLFLSGLITVFQSFVRFCQHFSVDFCVILGIFQLFFWVFSAAVTDPVCQYLQARCVELKLSCFCKLSHSNVFATCFNTESGVNKTWNRSAAICKSPTVSSSRWRTFSHFSSTLVFKATLTLQVVMLIFNCFFWVRSDFFFVWLFA